MKRMCPYLIFCVRAFAECYRHSDDSPARELEFECLQVKDLPEPEHGSIQLAMLPCFYLSPFFPEWAEEAC